MRDFFCLNVGKSGNIRLSGKIRINQAHVMCCLLSNQTKVCLVSLFIVAFGNERRIRDSDRKEKKNAGCGIFYKNLCSNRRSKSRMESDNLEEPLVFNYTIASSYHLGDLFLSFFLFFYRKRALMVSTFKLCRGDFRRCGSGWLKISAREL